MVELVDTQVLGTCAYGVGVRVPPWAPLNKINSFMNKKDYINFSHLEQVEESYFTHFRFAFWAGCVLFVLSITSIIHAIFPFMFARVPDKIYNYFKRESETRVLRVNSVLRRKGLE